MSNTTSRESKAHQLSRVAGGEYGEAISALADLSSTDDTGVALQVAAVLTGFAGPRAGLITFGGEMQPVGMNIISTSGALPNQMRLNNLMFGPVRFLLDSPTPEQITSSMGEFDRQSPFVLDGDYTKIGRGGCNTVF